ncbi:hypothetical protein LZ31DRAFT_552936 [Colletotrichum somersetense]|nr:hypothetical protein LZ31DRAFT_552936 [Colletotrichum somersetense]
MMQDAMCRKTWSGAAATLPGSTRRNAVPPPIQHTPIWAEQRMFVDHPKITAVCLRTRNLLTYAKTGW